MDNPGHDVTSPSLTKSGVACKLANCSVAISYRNIYIENKHLDALFRTADQGTVIAATNGQGFAVYLFHVANF